MTPNSVKLMPKEEVLGEDSLWRVCMSKQPKSSFLGEFCKSCKLENQQVTWNQRVTVERIPLPPPEFSRRALASRVPYPGLMKAAAPEIPTPERREAAR